MATAFRRFLLFSEFYWRRSGRSASIEHSSEDFGHKFVGGECCDIFVEFYCAECALESFELVAFLARVLSWAIIAEVSRNLHGFMCSTRCLKFLRGFKRQREIFLAFRTKSKLNCDEKLSGDARDTRIKFFGRLNIS